MKQESIYSDMAIANVSLADLPSDAQLETFFEDWEPYAVFKHTQGEAELIFYIGDYAEELRTNNELPIGLRNTMNEAFIAGYKYLCVYC